MLHLLAPVPAVHLPSAMDTFAARGRVAFGSNAYDVLAQVAAKEATFWIAATATDAPAAGVSGWTIGKIVLSGRLAAVTEARRGRHPDPGLRPRSTETDDEFHYAQYWEVEALTRLDPPLSPIGLRTRQKVALTRIPQGPILILDPQAPPP
jgi:hypothetical protein